MHLQVTSHADFFSNHWVQIVDGPGVGQAREITSYTTGGGQVAFTVTPAWDVPPTSSSRLIVTREVWQSYVVDNTVDNTGCELNPSHPEWETRPESGEISLWATMADSAVEGNVQTATDGIILQVNYSIPNPGGLPDQNAKTFVEVRGNMIVDEVNYGSYCSWSGIAVNYGAYNEPPNPNDPPLPNLAPILAYGVSIGRNTLDHTDALRGGAIVIENGGFPPDAGYPMVVNALIHNNVVQNLDNDPPCSCCAVPSTCVCDEHFPHRRGIHLHRYSYTPVQPIARTVLVGNTYPAGLVCQFLDDGMLNTVNLDTPPGGGWCPLP